jgi:hypothetical protein
MTTNDEHWIRPGQRRAIALLHGIGAEDPQRYWQAYLNVLIGDPALQDCGIFVWKYPTHIGVGPIHDALSTLNKRTIRQTAPEIRLLGAVWDTTYRAQFSEYEEVYLICHSMGGLVVKSWVIDALESGQSEDLQALRHIAFYATPHNGAPIDTLARWNKQLRNMQLNSPFIADTGRRWHNRVVAWKDRQLSSDDAKYNCYIPHLVIAGVQDQVVPETSASIQGMHLTVVPGDHSQCIQPPTSRDTRYKTWRDAVEKLSAPSASTSSAPSASANQPAPSQQPPAGGLQASAAPTPGSFIPASTSGQRQQPSSPPAPQKFFISYAPANENWATWIAAELEKAGHTTFLQAWDVRPGSNRILATHLAIAESERIVMVFSPAYLQAALAQAEWTSVFLADPTSTQRRLVPVRIEPCDLAGLLGPIVPIDIMNLNESEARKQLLDGI